jgi:CheY-like chemotaxis protein
VNLLLVEDAQSDIDLVEETLEELALTHTLYVVRDGEAAIAFLQQQAPHADAPRPDLVILDLNLPRRNGYEVLAVVKSTPHLRQIPIIILTTSDSRQDVVHAYDLHANAYMVKPDDINELVERFRALDHYWDAHVLLPSKVSEGG